MNNHNSLHVLRIFAFIVLNLILALWFIRLVSPSQIDDVNPLMGCTDEILDKGDIYFVVPKFNNVSILEAKGWCKDILARDKELAMHGVYHSFEEFGVYRNEEYFGEGVEIFRDCFGFTPKRFKPGQLKFSKENNWIMERMDVDLFWNQVFHKVYHCGDTGLFPNWVVRIF